MLKFRLGPVAIGLLLIAARATAADAAPSSTPAAPAPSVPQLSPQRPAVFERNFSGTLPLSINGDWTPYGLYLKKLIDAVDARWQSSVKATSEKPPSETSISVTFVLNDEGAVTSARADAPKIADTWVQLCIKAINPGPDFRYEAWTPQMVSVLGKSRDLTFHFLYR
jgi:hypothetical protein